MVNAFRAQDAACTRCTFFDDAAASSAAEKLGMCRYNPPVSQPSADAHGLWPMVSTSDWCGHYQPQAA